MTYKTFHLGMNAYTQTVSAGGSSPIARLEHDFGDGIIRLLNSDEIQQKLDEKQALAAISGTVFDAKKEKGKLIARTVGDLSKEARLEYGNAVQQYAVMSSEEKKAFMAQIAGFYQFMTGKDAYAGTGGEQETEMIRKVMGTDDISNLSEEEKVLAVTVMQKTQWKLENQDLRNTDAMESYHAFTVENKSANPLGFYKSRIETLPEETKRKLQDKAHMLLPVTHNGGAWHEMTHCLGTEDERKCEGFRFLKILETYKDPELLYPDINARMAITLNIMDTIRKEEISGNRTLSGNFKYVMPGMLLNVLENAASLEKKVSTAKSEQGIMNETLKLVEKTAYPPETEKEFRAMAKECPTTEAFAQRLKEIHQKKEPATLYTLVNDCVKVAQKLNPEATAETLFLPENMTSKARNAGKVDISASGDIRLDAQEIRFYQDIYSKCREENPAKKGEDFDRILAVEIVKANWQKKEAVEQTMENPKTAKDILFNPDNAAKATAEINRCLECSHQAANIVRQYSPRFEKGYEQDKSGILMKQPVSKNKEKKTGLMKQLMEQHMPEKQKIRPAVRRKETNSR